MSEFITQAPSINEAPTVSGSRLGRRITGVLVGIGLSAGMISCATEEGPKSMAPSAATATPYESSTSGVPVSQAVETDATAAVVETTTPLSPTEYERLKDLFSTEVDDLTFECLDEGAETGAIKVVIPSGSSDQYVVPRSNHNLPVDGTKITDDNRVASDASTAGLIGDTKEQLNDANSANGCEDVLTLFASLNFIANFPLPSGIRVSELNEFFKMFEGDPSKVNDLATEYMAKIERMAGPEDLEAYHFVQDAARRFDAFKSNYDNKGVQVAVPGSYFHLKDLGVDRNEAGVPEVEIVDGSYGDNPDTVIVENKFLVLSGETKADGCVVEWGINLNDQRLVTLKNEECKLPPIATTTTTISQNGTTTTIPATTTTAAGTTTTSEVTTTVPPTTAPPTTALKGSVPTTVAEDCSQYAPCP